MMLPITETEYLVAVTYKLQNKNVLYTFIYFFEITQSKNISILKIKFGED